MTNVVGIKGITPEVLAQHIVEDAPNMESIHVIAFSKGGEVWKYLSGSGKDLALASLILQDLALKLSRGEPL